MARVNRSIAAWPGEDEPLEGFETVKATYKKLSSGLTDIKEAAEAEAKSVYCQTAWGLFRRLTRLPILERLIRPLRRFLYLLPFVKRQKIL